MLSVITRNVKNCQLYEKPTGVKQVSLGAKIQRFVESNPQVFNTVYQSGKGMYVSGSYRTSQRVENPFGFQIQQVLAHLSNHFADMVYSLEAVLNEGTVELTEWMLIDIGNGQHYKIYLNGYTARRKGSGSILKLAELVWDNSAGKLVGWESKAGKQADWNNSFAQLSTLIWQVIIGIANLPFEVAVLDVSQVGGDESDEGFHSGASIGDSLLQKYEDSTFFNPSFCTYGLSTICKENFKQVKGLTQQVGETALLISM